MIKNIKIHNILDIIEISKYMKPNKCIKFFNENVHLNVSYDFSKFNQSKKIKMWCSCWYRPRMSLPFCFPFKKIKVWHSPPKNGLALLFSLQENQSVTFTAQEWACPFLFPSRKPKCDIHHPRMGLPFCFPFKKIKVWHSQWYHPRMGLPFCFPFKKIKMWHSQWCHPRMSLPFSFPF